MGELCGMWGPPNGWLCRLGKGHSGQHVYSPTEQQMKDMSVEISSRSSSVVSGKIMDEIELDQQPFEPGRLYFGSPVKGAFG